MNAAATVQSASPPPDLLEREAELAVLRAAAIDAASGDGRVALITGPAGVGKTRLLKEVRGAGLGEDAQTLFGRAGELEREYPFGVVRQLFEPLLSDPAIAESAFAGSAAPARAIFDIDQAGDDAEAVASFAVLHGLYWLTLNIANERPLAIVIDDLQWCDSSSLRFVAYLVRRLEGLPLLLAATVRTTDPGTDPALLGEIMFDPSTVEVRPAPLTEQGVGAVLKARLGDRASDQVATNAFVATGGNPLMLRELMGAIESNATDAASGQEGFVGEVGARSVARTVALRMARLPESARTCARAISILGESSSLRTIAAFTDLSEPEVASAITELIKAEILLDEMPPAFLHPLIRDVVYEDTPRGQRELQHLEAARLLAELGLGRDHVASQLMHAPIAADDWVAGQLRKAGNAAFNSGAPEGAVPYLRRALEEDAPATDRGRLLLELGTAEAMTSSSDAIATLKAAYESLTDPELRSFALAGLARTLIFIGEPEEAARLLDAERKLLPEELIDERSRLEALAAMAIFFAGGDPEELKNLHPHREGPLGDTVGEKMMAAMASIDWTYRGGDRDACIALASRAMDDGEIFALDPSLIGIAGIATFIYQDHPRSLDLLDADLRAARASGSLLGVSSVSLWRGAALLLQGDLPASIEQLETAMSEFRMWGMGPGGTRYAVGFMATALSEVGELDRARELISSSEDTGEVEEGNRIYLGGQLALQFADGQFAEAVVTADKLLERFPDTVNSAIVRARLLKARSLHRLGRSDEAAEVLESELEITRAAGTPAPLGAALRALAEMNEGDERLAALNEAVDVLAGSVNKLERAKALAALGRELRLRGEREQGLTLESEALETAELCGAAPLIGHIRDSLKEAGVRTQSVNRGAEALTPSERRVADLARAGNTNREIAQLLFVTPKTVEVHLSKTYEKLGIRSRKDLVDVLPAAD